MPAPSFSSLLAFSPPYISGLPGRFVLLGIRQAIRQFPDNILFISSIVGFSNSRTIASTFIKSREQNPHCSAPSCARNANGTFCFLQFLPESSLPAPRSLPKQQGIEQEEPDFLADPDHKVCSLLSALHISHTTNSILNFLIHSEVWYLRILADTRFPFNLNFTSMLLPLRDDCRTYLPLKIRAFCQMLTIFCNFLS